MRKVFFVLFVLLLVLPLTWFFINEFEGKAPEIQVEFPSVYLNNSYEISLVASDKGTGLRRVAVSIAQKGKEEVLLEKEYPFSGYKGLFMGSKIYRDSFQIPVESWKYGMTDGEAVIKIDVLDYSWKDWNNGNRVVKKKRVIIDTSPPKIEVLSRRHNVERGGAGLVLYRLFEENIKSGVTVGDNFFPGYSGMFEDKDIYASFFALSYTQGPGVEINVTAADPAGNRSSRGFYYYIRDTKFKTDVLNISDRFLSRKMPEFDVGEKQLTFDAREKPLLEKFIYINRVVRTENIRDVLAPVVDTEPVRFWQGRFLRLPGSANRASFADHRIYKYKGEEIDRQVHMGMDLASVTRAPVPAANSGRILSTDRVGIFGNSVLIDHGFGLTTIYSHLSTVLVKKGDRVEKGDIIGKSGSTGLAGGDHLHFGVAVNNVFVNPVEWWDLTWIKNNILSKIEYVEKLQYTQ